MKNDSLEKDEMKELEKFVKKAEQENFVLKKLLEIEKTAKASSKPKHKQ